MGSLRTVSLYAHHVTPTYTKYNLLGILHIANGLRKAIIRRVRVLYGYTYAVELLAEASDEELIQDLIDSLQAERGEIVKAEGRHYRTEDGFRFVCRSSGSDPYFNATSVCRYVEYLSGKAPSLPAVGRSGKSKSSAQVPEADVLRSVLEMRAHDKRSSSGGSPSLILAPELGKYSRSEIPYRSSYPDISDYGGASACLLFALIGWACCSFKWEIAEENASHHVFAYVAPKVDLEYFEAEALYQIGRRLAYMTTLLARAGRSGEARERLSTHGILALLSPAIRDVTESAELLSKLELNVYTHSFEGGRHSVRAAGAFGLVSVDVKLLPSRLVGAVLAYIRYLPALVSEVPSFFNILGEYLTSGNDALYVEALRELAVALSDDGVSRKAKRMATVILKNAVR